jgi:two-component system, OmpR family, phosphate regulon response regulator PhoB
MTASAQPVDETIRVLFIESDPAAAEMYKLKLELDGYQVNLLGIDDQTINEAGMARPDMIYLDIRRHEAEGLATLHALRAAEGTRAVPVVILSNHSSSEMADRGFKADILDHIVRADPGPTALTWNVDDWARIQAS